MLTDVCCKLARELYCIRYIYFVIYRMGAASYVYAACFGIVKSLKHVQQTSVAQFGMAIAFCS